MLRYLNDNILDLVPMRNLQMIFTDSDQTKLIAQSLVFKIDDPDFALPKHTIAKIKDHCRGTPISFAYIHQQIVNCCFQSVIFF